MKSDVNRGPAPRSISLRSACVPLRPSGSKGASTRRPCPQASNTSLSLPFGLDEATLALDSLVEETHQTLIRDGYIEIDDCRPGAPICEQLPVESAGGTSLDAVDRALEELKRGLFEIDNALGRTACR